RYMMRKARMSSSRPRPEGPGGLRARSVTPLAMDVFRNKFISGLGAAGQGPEGRVSYRLRRAGQLRITVMGEELFSVAWVTIRNFLPSGVRSQRIEPAVFPPP